MSSEPKRNRLQQPAYTSRRYSDTSFAPGITEAVRRARTEEGVYQQVLRLIAQIQWWTTLRSVCLQGEAEESCMIHSE